MAARTLHWLSLGVIIGGVALMPGAALPQGAPPGGVTRPPPVEAAPLPPPPSPDMPGPATPGPAAPPSTVSSPPPGPATVPPAPAAPAATARPTLVPGTGDPMNVDEVTLPSKAAAVLSGTSTWDDGLTNLKTAFRRIEEELTRAAVSPAGRPLTVFTDTDDLGFRYDAMIPIAEIPAGRAALTPEIRFGRTPDGKALRFVHKAPYEEIDGTYETITAYLDAKGLVVKDAFIEEYVSDLKEATDADLEINIFVQPK